MSTMTRTSGGIRAALAATLVVEAEDDAITLDKVQFLSGAEAAAAMAEDAQPLEEGVEMPYVRNRNPALRTLPVAADVAVEVLDCSAECTHVPWAYEDLVADRPLPYGPEDALFEVTVTDGTVTSIREVYLA